jgi:broad specificity phosphatase PhoE
VRAIAAGNSGKTVCVVSHGCAIRNFLCHVLGRPLEQINTVPWCDNTAVSIIDYDDRLRPTAVLMNDASHLDEATSTLGRQDWWKEFEPGDKGE